MSENNHSREHLNPNKIKPCTQIIYREHLKCSKNQKSTSLIGKRDQMQRSQNTNNFCGANNSAGREGPRSSIADVPFAGDIMPFQSRNIQISALKMAELSSFQHSEYSVSQEKTIQRYSNPPQLQLNNNRVDNDMASDDGNNDLDSFCNFHSYSINIQQKRADQMKINLRKRVMSKRKYRLSKSLSSNIKSLSLNSHDSYLQHSAIIPTSAIASQPLKKQKRSSDNKKLVFLSKKVLEEVSTKKMTTSTSIANNILDIYKERNMKLDFKNIQRRVYDALNVLSSLEVINKNRNKITFRGYAYLLKQASLYEAFHANLDSQHSLGTKNFGTQELIDMIKIADLQQQVAEAKQKVDEKFNYMMELVIQKIALKKLIERNYELRAQHRSIKHSETVDLPFLIVKIKRDSNSEVLMNENKQELIFQSNQVFQLYNENHVFKATGLAAIQYEDIQSMFPSRIHQKIVEKLCLTNDQQERTLFCDEEPLQQDELEILQSHAHLVNNQNQQYMDINRFSHHQSSANTIHGSIYLHHLQPQNQYPKMNLESHNDHFFSSQDSSSCGFRNLGVDHYPLDPNGLRKNSDFLGKNHHNMISNNSNQNKPLKNTIYFHNPHGSFYQSNLFSRPLDQFSMHFPFQGTIKQESNLEHQIDEYQKHQSFMNDQNQLFSSQDILKNSPLLHSHNNDNLYNHNQGQAQQIQSPLIQSSKYMINDLFTKEESTKHYSNFSNVNHQNFQLQGGAFNASQPPKSPLNIHQIIAPSTQNHSLSVPDSPFRAQNIPLNNNYSSIARNLTQ